MNVEEAESKIAMILKKLEIATGELVKKLSLEGIDVTNLESTRQQLQMRVKIEMVRLPGHGWGE